MKFCNNTKFVGAYDGDELQCRLHYTPYRKYFFHEQDSL